MKKLFIAGILLGTLITFFVVLNMKFVSRGNQWAEYYKSKVEANKRGIEKEASPYGFSQYMKDIKTEFGKDKISYSQNYLMREYNKARKNRPAVLKAAPEVTWVKRGPYNVAGRTRGLIIDPDDSTAQTWFAATATGGVWKTINGGSSWEHITNEIPYLATTTIAMAPSNIQVLYLGTGESFPGSALTIGGGIFKSTNKGLHWNQLAFTANNSDFEYINRIIINPDNDSIVLAATNTGIFKTTDGGANWKKKYTASGAVEDLTCDTSDFNYQYAGVNGVGIVRSIDAGETWQLKSEGIIGGNRFEVAVSPVNPNNIFTSVAGNSEAKVYFSNDKAESWTTFYDSIFLVDDILVQGDYNNTIEAHPYDENTVFVGGVNLWKITFGNNVVSGDSLVSGIDYNNADSLLEFIPFGSQYLGIGLGTEENGYGYQPGDWVSVEIRFGPGKSQMAHRFTVPNQATSGVSYTEYTYQDYVEVPFEVWDIDNNRQLMVSFRDQEKDGGFNLYERTDTTEATSGAYNMLGREYIFISPLDYNASIPDANITTTGGHTYRMLYFIWVNLADGADWIPQNLPEHSFIIKYSINRFRIGALANLSDAYGQYSNVNGYLQNKGLGTTAIPGFHPDHHNLLMIPKSQQADSFWILNANDGGLGISYNSGNKFQQITNGMLTTQFYGVAKKPHRDEYIGGMQDNGTWQSAINQSANENSEYFFRLGGDGFEAVWHHTDTNKMMGSLYNNDIYKSVDGGVTWVDADGDINLDGPFLTKLATSVTNPNVVYAVGSDGLWKTANFARSSWKKIILNNNWAPDGFVTSQHQVEVSLADSSIIWAGAGLNGSFGYGVHVSVNDGESFTQVSEFTQRELLGFLTNIETHPNNPNTAYLTFGISGHPKILRTNDLGQTWEDITGFGNASVSSNGFPDVAVYSLFVFPNSPDVLWAGTEIGIIESLDNGVSWHLADNGMPAVHIWQMKSYDGQLVVATFGAGIWTYRFAEDPGFPDPVQPPVSTEDIEQAIAKTNVYPIPASEYLNISVPVNVHSALVSLIDYSGKIVYKGMLDIHNGTGSLITGNITDGTYICRIEFNSVVSNKTIIIRH